jgi:hypothetical protein
MDHLPVYLSLLLIILAALLVVTALIRVAGLRLGEFTIPSFFVVMYFVAVFAGCVILLFGLDEYALSIGVRNPDIVLKLFGFSSIGMLLVLSGFVFANKAIGVSPPAPARITLVPSIAQQRWFFIGLFAVSCAVLALYLSKIETVAITAALSGDLVAAAVARTNMGTSFENYWRYELFFRHVMDLCVLYFVADFGMRPGVRSGTLAASSLAVASFTAVMSIEKSPIVMLLVSVYLVLVLLRGGRYWQPELKYFAPVVLGLAALMYMLFMGTLDFVKGLEQLAYRVLTGQIIPAYFYLERFPHDVDYLWGLSLPNPAGIFPFDSYPLTREIASVISPGSVADGVIGSAPTVFWGEMYANFGLAGVLFSSFVLGIALFILGHVLGRVPLSPAMIATTVTLAMHYQFLTATGVSSYLFDTRLGVILAITFVALVLGRRKGRTWRSKRVTRPSASRKLTLSVSSRATT